jgi:hypothetical protein
MAVLEGGASGALAGVGVESNSPLHVVTKPIPVGALGHYRTAVAITMAISQAANSRLFEVRNTATNLIIPTRIRIGVIAVGTVTTPYTFLAGLFRCTGFTAVDTTNTVTPVSSVKRTSMAAYPGGAAVRHNTLAGAAAGMTGGTLTKDTQAIGLAAAYAVTGAAGTQVIYQELLSDDFGGSPLILAQNEGFEIENVNAGSATANGLVVILDVAWAECVAY